jgi:hypothetical protein
VRGIRKTAAQIMTDPIRAIVRHNRWMTVLLPLFITIALLSYHFSSLFYCRPTAMHLESLFLLELFIRGALPLFIPRLLALFIPRLLALFITMFLALLSLGYWYFSSPFCCSFPSSFHTTVTSLLSYSHILSSTTSPCRHRYVATFYHRTIANFYDFAMPLFSTGTFHRREMEMNHYRPNIFHHWPIATFKLWFVAPIHHWFVLFDYAA